ncbi:disease resistance At4g27190-like [Olea europaea subsp. europaea]|uniref:Disease resistance At4g27190-like n=1 Tax=Olea europaea subsp. europaea TaxID=158383 RepID=A0A8S0QRB9_OLEEU|nr:disease resistance At4g27190-like [Olea europaea subsp. europaea]
MAVDIVFSVVGKLAEYTIDPILSQFKYMFCSKTKIQTLMYKVKDLEIRESDLYQLVVEVERNAEAIKPGVKDWVRKVNDLKKQAYEVLEANEVKVEKLFDEVAIAIASQDLGVTKIQDQLVDMLGLKTEEKTNKIVRAGRLRERLGGGRGKNILIILDDVWEDIELETIGILSASDENSINIML